APLRRPGGADRIVIRGRSPPGTQPRVGELTRRIASVLVLVPLALIAAYVGGWLFAAFWGIAALGGLWGGVAVVGGSARHAVLAIASAAIVLALALVVMGYAVAAVMVLAMGALGAAVLAPAIRRSWIALGVPYAGAVALAPTLLRAEGREGFPA